jgi:hypothetical protein
MTQSRATDMCARCATARARQATLESVGALKAVGVALIWIGALSAVLAARTGIPTAADGTSQLKLVASIIPAHVALVASWWVVHDRARKPAAVLPRVVRNAAWLARALGWVTIAQLGVVVLILFVDPPVFVAVARAAAGLGDVHSFDLVMSTYAWSQPESALLACVATVAPVVAGSRAKRVLYGGAVRPLRRAAGLSALAYALVVVVMSPNAWRPVGVQQWIADVGFLLGGFFALVTTQAWHMRAAAMVASGGGLVVSIAVFVALGRAAREEEAASGLSGHIGAQTVNADAAAGADDDVVIGGVDVE